MITRLAVYFAYLLKTSSRYQRSKMFFYDLLENPQSRRKSYFDVFMIMLVMISVILLILEVNTELTASVMIFEQMIVSIFIFEYLLRGWLYSDSHKLIIAEYEKAAYLETKFSIWKLLLPLLRKKIEYIFSPVAIIDLLAIMPSFRPLRIFRVLLIFRLFKLFRYSQSIKIFSDVLADKRIELFTLAMFIGFLVFIASTAIYMFENRAEGGQIRHLYDAVYWSVVTLSTVGYGDITPQTLGGRLVTLSLIVTGLGVLSFFTSIIVSAFNEKMDEMNESQTYAAIDKLQEFVIICGFGRVGQEIAMQMKSHQQKFVIIDFLEKNLLVAKKMGGLIIRNDACKNEVLELAGINKGATAVLCTTGNDVTNVYVALSSRHLNPEINIISRANRKENVNKLKQAGANHVIQPFAIAGLLAAEFVGQPVASEAILGILNNEKKVLMDTLTVTAGSLIDNMPLKSLDLIQRKLTLVGVISANPQHIKHKNRYKVHNLHFYFNPEQHFLLQSGDILVLLGRKYSIDFFRDQMVKNSLKGIVRAWIKNTF